jgi:hypothetical protein
LLLLTLLLLLLLLLLLGSLSLVVVVVVVVVHFLLLLLFSLLQKGGLGGLIVGLTGDLNDAGVVRVILGVVVVVVAVADLVVDRGGGKDPAVWGLEVLSRANLVLAVGEGKDTTVSSLEKVGGVPSGRDHRCGSVSTDKEGSLVRMGLDGEGSRVDETWLGDPEDGSVVVDSCVVPGDVRGTVGDRLGVTGHGAEG